MMATWRSTKVGKSFESAKFGRSRDVAAWREQRDETLSLSTSVKYEDYAFSLLPICVGLWTKSRSCVAMGIG